ncbi:MAG: T9SS type A sorting domain-containing protein [Bacteroidales bacterium]|nr:T9SS type A sorting domain-containing protein [Bacteroidales bacterium]
MKHIFPIAFFSLLSLAALAQETTVFNRNYPYEYYYHCNNMQIVNNEYILVGGINYENTYCNQWLQGLHITKIDSSGELQSTFPFSKCNSNVYNENGSFAINAENEFVFAGQEFSIISEENHLFFIKLNENFDTTCIKRFYEDTIAKRCWNMNLCSDGGYILVGSVDSTRSEYYTPEVIRGQVLLIRLDCVGNASWSRSIAFSNNFGISNWQSGRKAIETWDKGFLVIGLNHDFEQNIMSPFIMKTDSLGNFKWKQIFPSGSFNSPELMDIIETRDSGYVVCGARAYGEEFGGLYPYDGWLYKFDTNGVGIWQKIYREYHPEPQDYRDTIYCYFYSMCELPDGRIAVTGTARKTPEWDFRRPFLYMLNSNGDSLYTRHYTYFPLGDPSFISYSYPNKIVQTDDGGFAIAGWGVCAEWIEEEQHWEQPERIFLIKTDSLGNDVYTSISPPLQSPEDKFTVYPNPAFGWVTVTAPAEDVLELYGSTGSVALKTNLSKGENRIALTGLMPGMYLARLKNTGMAAKLVVQ